MSNFKNETCPLCPNHCPTDHLKCGKGHSHFQNDRQTTGNHHFHREYSRGFGNRRKIK